MGHLWSSSGCDGCKHTLTRMHANTHVAWQPTAGPGLQYWWRWLINLWKWLSHMPDLPFFFFNPTQLVSTPWPPWRNNRSITPFCHLTEREKWGSDWKGSLASWCCVSGLSVRRETLMDCRGVETHTHTESLQGVETFPCCSSQGGRALLLFYPRIITHYEEHIVDKECGQSVTNLPFFTIISLMLCYAATEAYNGVT